MKHLLFAATLLALLVLPARAADIDGTWTREAQGRGGTTTQTLMLKAEGMKLTGTLDAGRGGATEISDGKIDGNKVSFKVVREFNGNSFTQMFEGTMSGKELSLNVTAEGGRGGGKGGKGKGPQGPQVFMKK